MKLGAESRGMADGVADVGIVSTVFEAPKFPLQNNSYFTPFGTPDIDLVSKSVTALVEARLAYRVKAGAKISEFPQAEPKRWADSLSPMAKVWAADIQSKGMPADQVLNGYMKDLRDAGTTLPRDWSK